MLVHMLLRVSALSLGLSYVVCTTPQQQSQLATLHERMNQMISALYSSPLLSKVKASSSSEEAPATAPESTYSYPSPQVVFVSPPSYLETPQPTDYGYQLPSLLPRPAYSFDYSYQPQFSPVYPPSPLPRSPYPEYPRYPQLPTPAPQPSFPPFAPVAYPSFSSPQYPRPPYGYQPSYPAPGLPSPYLSQVPYPPMPVPPPTSLPVYPQALPYPQAALPSPYPALPQQYAPAPYFSPVPFPSMSAPYFPPSVYSQSYPALSKPADILPQPQYEYSS